MTVQKTAHPTGGVKELLLLFFPLVLTTFSTSFYIFIEKVFLGALSIKAMEAAVSAAYACQIFQAPCVALSMMAQVFIGRWYGAGNYASIGSGMWQFIWFALLSSLITVPLGWLLGQYYFEGGGINEIVFPYYYTLLFFNFLFPLGASLTCFYLGQGKTRLILFSTLAIQMLKILLGYLLIFGWEPWFSALGMLGGVLSTILAQTTFCLILLSVFLNNKNKELFHSRDYRFRPSFFWECIQPGLLRAGNRILGFGCWASIAYLMSARGGNHLLILSVGGVISLFLSFIADALCQAQVTVTSQILGTHQFTLLNRSLKSCLLVALGAILLPALPLLAFHKEVFQYFFPAVHLDIDIIFNTLLGVCLCFFFYTIGFIFIAYILAFKDTKFSLFMGFVCWINGFLLMYIAIEYMKIPADQFWNVLSIMHATTAFMYYLRMRWLQSRLVGEIATVNYP